MNTNKIVSEKLPMATQAKVIDGTVAQDWYFTFGFGHPNAGCYTVIHGTCDESREEMFRRYGRKWSMQYPEQRWVKSDGRTQAEIYGLRRID